MTVKAEGAVVPTNAEVCGFIAVLNYEGMRATIYYGSVVMICLSVERGSSLQVRVMVGSESV